ITLSSGVARAVTRQTSRASISLDTTWPPWRSRYSSISNSLTVRSSGRPPHNRPRHQVHREIALLPLQDVIPTATTQERPNSRQQLGERERFDQIVVGAAVESLHPILDGVLRGQDQDGSLEPAPAQCGQHLESVSSWEHEVEDNEVECVV